MKVICINASDGENKVASILLKEGAVYNVWQCEVYKNNYNVEGALFDPKNGIKVSFRKSRFIPLSSIDETQTQLYKEQVTEKV